MSLERGSMSADSHKLVFRRLIDEGFNGGQLATLDDLLTTDFVDHSPCQRLGGAAELRERIALLRIAMPDLHICVDQLAVGDGMTWATVTVRGTARGLPGQLASDGCLGFSRIDTCRYVNGRIAEYWSETPDLLEQLGITVP
jgi:hypothetical protein